MPRKPNPNPCYYAGTKLNEPREVEYAERLLKWSAHLDKKRVTFAEFEFKTSSD